MKKLKNMYESEFAKHQISLIKNRVRFFCFLPLLIYFLGTVMSFVIIPRALDPREVFLAKLFLMLSGSIFIIVQRAKSMRFAKICAYVYSMFLVYLLTQINIIYPNYMQISSTTYIFAFFLVCFSIPWHQFEIIYLTIIHITAYTFLFMHVHNQMPDKAKELFDVFSYFGGFIFLCMGLVLGFIIRRKENRRELENFILLKEQERRNTQIREELDLAARVYETLLPKPISTDLIDIDLLYIPVSYMSGDYAQFYFIDNDLLIFIICDITGHGVSAALVVNRMHTEFERLTKEGKGPEEILRELNLFILNEFGDINIFMSACCGLIDLQEMRLTYSNYGHPDQYLYNAEMKNLVKISSETTLLGLAPDTKINYQNAVLLNAGDRIVLFTDGLTEATNKKDIEYGKERLEYFIKKNHSLSAKDFNNKLLMEVKAFKSGDFKDDIFLINMVIKNNSEKNKH